MSLSRFHCKRRGAHNKDPKTGSKLSVEMLNHTHPRTSFSQTLISAIRTSEGSKLGFLRNLYGLLVCLSNESILGCNGKDRSEPCAFAMNSDDRENVGELLFKELECRFDKFFSALSHVSESSDLNSSAFVDELTPLLRCCMVLLTLADPDVASEKTQILFWILGRLVSCVHRGDKNRSVTFEKRGSREFSYSDAAGTTSVSEDYIALLSITEPPHPCSPSLRVVLEVFVDELLMHRLLREYFIRVAAASASFSVLPCHFLSGGIGFVLELVSLQFIVSLSDEERFENFVNKLSCRALSNIKVCEISLTSFIPLLLNPTILSAPKVLQVHLMLLVCEAIGTAMSEKVQPNLSIMRATYLTIFERSILLYNGFMSTFLMEGHPIGRKALCKSRMLFDRSSETSFECHIQEKTREKLNDIVARLSSSWNMQCHTMYDKTRSKLLVDSIVVGEGQVNESCKIDILEIINSIVLGAFSDSVTDSLLYKKDETSPQDAYLLAAVLKLISCSMSAVIRCLRLDGENLICSGETSVRKDYDFIANIIGSFQHFNVSLPNQKKLFDKMETSLIKNKTTKWMILHISGLLSLSFASGFDFLVENCIFILVGLMNLYVFEEGNVGALRSVLVPGLKSITSQGDLDKHGEALVDKKSCQKIASKIQKIRSMYLSSESRSLNPEDGGASIYEESSARIEGETEETSKKVFLDCLLGDSSDLPEYDDLADFIECKAGKDYSSWLKDKERHRMWRYKKMLVLKCKRRKKTLNFLNGS